MGTVGLSFGSPTGGAGFDVTSTVNQIVSNMQAIETPWKSQLTTLQSQDSALTGIGTDLSSLSTAMQSLTNFEGVLAEKQGSSSDTSLLQLTSASTSAIAGTHTVVVQSLATTSSYVSGTIANAGDTLSGNLEINGKTITIDSSNNTFSSLASTINSGSYGLTANVITDSSGTRLSLVSQTSGASGAISVTSNLSDTSTSSSVNFSQTQPGADAQLTVDGVLVASSSNTVTNAIQGVTFQLLSANKDESIQVEITNDNTDVETALNTFVTDYNKVLQDLNTQEGSDSNGNPEPLFGNPTIALLQQSLQSALTFVQPSNTVASSSSVGSSDALSGKILIGVGGGSQEEIDIPDNSSMADVAAAINSANIGVTAAIITSGNNAILSLTNATSGSSGAISVDASGLTDTSTGNAVTFGSAQSNTVTSITQLGVSVNNDGTLTLDTDALDSLLNSNYQGVVNFLQPSGNYTSFGGNFTNILDNLGSSAPSGAIYLALQEDSQVETQLNTNISNEETIITAQKAQLTTELTQANYTLTEIPQQLEQINEMYSAITGYNEGQNG
ncbi:flagellar filament capping protein FliD [Acidobacterium sp. S8]|uniref:flagellar filament capping protein FliD n=1 Tax=Acidobacterium sp. S8 TaxID=1641854 RepID=UPI00131C210E|nr:flagellar filament capping protein FliD [Acidobacterium sp. S8]